MTNKKASETAGNQQETKTDEARINPPATDGASQELLDPFDPKSYLTCAILDDVTAEKLLQTIPVRKPNRQTWFQVHPELSADLPVIELKDDPDGGTYLIAPELVHNVGQDNLAVFKRFFPVVSRQKIITLWGVRLPDSDGRLDGYSRSALGAAEIAKTSWVKITASRSLRGYEVHVAKAIADKPDWSPLPSSMRDVLQLAFQDRMITKLDHPILRQLRGEA